MGFEETAYPYTKPARRSSWRPEVKQFSQRRFRFLLRCTVAAAVTGILFLVALHRQYRHDLQEKYSATIFSNDSERRIHRSEWEASAGSLAERPIQREEWKRIGGGWEGEIFLYEDTVIKTFVTTRSPLRNCLDSSSSPTRIPTEIPATLVLGGLQDEVAEDADFLPLKGYLLAPATETEPASWLVLTPYLPSGNLQNVAMRLRSENLNHRDLDARFRPSLNRLLGALARMHGEHGLCHDDIKLSNVFVTDYLDATVSDTHWVLADFGNVREVTHPYHSSVICTRDSEQNADCRINDAVRLIKTYVTFLRLASIDTVSFDSAFWAEIEPWSELYWSAVKGARLGSGAAESFQDNSLSIAPIRSGEPTPQVEGAWSLGCLLGLPCLAQRTEEEMERGMFVTEDKARLFGATGTLLGVPTGEC
ncbi:Uu.00g079400.m01.CDS01 [Anthostomella pinea]|uniref:Uu.00g079400.m01.CDS01 n=1 Tax=Anthostomella pinea TaxID=933095 RepID=A0AAI8VKT4_9PEZI|nr:Uu.00g079400.m01.CDS01 [Anthostomella pinea]